MNALLTGLTFRMNALLTGLTSNNASTHNGAVSHSTSGSFILDYFAECGSYQNRPQESVDASMAKIFGEDEVEAFKVVLYNRMITRKIAGFTETEGVQKGQGQKDEFIKSLKWLEINRPKLLYKNLWMIPSVGSWKDLWYDSPVSKLSNYVSPPEVYKLIKKALRTEYHRALLAKLLPKIRSNSNTTNERHIRLNAWARGLCAYLGWSEKDYRKFKSSPDNSAHLWQRLACENKWDEIDFNMIPGKALFNLVKGELLSKHGIMTAYEKWIEKQPVAKFTGYPFELYNEAKKARNTAKTFTYNKQFEKLLENAKSDMSPELLEKGVLCALDTSASMSSFDFYGATKERKYAPIDVCVGLGIYFSSLLKGAFEGHVAMFDSTSRLVKLTGNFCDRVDQISHQCTAWGSTNFQSLVDMLCDFRKRNPQVPLTDYPKVLLVVSDMQLDRSGNKTNQDAALNKLKSVGLSMNLVWWNVDGHEKEVPAKMNDEGITLISGFDPSIVSIVLKGTEQVVDEKTGEKRSKTPFEVMNDCLGQEILTKVKK